MHKTIFSGISESHSECKEKHRNGLSLQHDTDPSEQSQPSTSRLRIKIFLQIYLNKQTNKEVKL